MVWDKRSSLFLSTVGDEEKQVLRRRHLFVQLELRLDVLRRVGDADLYAAGDGPGDDALQKGVGPGLAGPRNSDCCSSQIC